MGMAGLSAEQGLFLRLGLSALLVLLLVLPRISQYGQAWSTPEGKKGMLLILAFEGGSGDVGDACVLHGEPAGRAFPGGAPGLHPALWGFLLGVLLHGEKVTALKAGGVAAMLLGIVPPTFNILV